MILKGDLHELKMKVYATFEQCSVIDRSFLHLCVAIFSTLLQKQNPPCNKLVKRVVVSSVLLLHNSSTAIIIVFTGGKSADLQFTSFKF